MPANKGAPRALIVDDDEAHLRVCARTLVEHGYEVETATGAESALRAVLAAAPFDVIVSDIQMPGMSGVDFVAQLRADGFDVPVVLVTGAPTIETAMKAVEHGVLRYLTKPLTPRALVVGVNEAVRLHGIARAERAALDNDALRSLVEELRRSKDAAHAGTRAKAEFLSKMGHELRTPMTAIVGMTGLALDTELTPEQREYLQCVQTNADLLMQVIGAVLVFSDLAGGRLQLESKIFNVRDTINDTLKAHLASVEAKGLSLLCQIGSDVPEALTGDPARFQQIVDSLVSNAVKFTRKGAVRIGAYLEAHSDDREARLCITISDTGIGIPAGALASVVEAFSQGDNSSTRPYGGAGLGLTIASQLATLMNASLKLESTPNVGTIVRFTACFDRVPAADGFFLIDSHTQ